MSKRNSHALTTLLCLTATTVFAADPPKPKSASSTTNDEQGPRISSKVEMQPVAALSDEEANEVSFAAGRVLKHIVQARDAIRENKTDEATGHVEQALKLIAIIDGVLPHYKVTTQIQSGDLTYTDEEDVTPRYVMLFDELERRDIISPIVEAKKESHRASQKEQRAEASDDEASGAFAVSHVDLNYSTAKLDISLTRHMLGRANRHLREGQPAMADETLRAVQSVGVLFEYEEIDLPLEEAADNLKLAEIEMLAGRTTEAKAALHTAVDQLKDYEELVGENRGTEVKELHQEIAKLTKELDQGNVSTVDQQKQASRIADWWQRATKWFKSRRQ